MDMDPRFFNSFYGPRAWRLGHKAKENIRQVTYGSDRTLKCVRSMYYHLWKYISNLTITVEFHFSARISLQELYSLSGLLKDLGFGI